MVFTKIMHIKGVVLDSWEELESFLEKATPNAFEKYTAIKKEWFEEIENQYEKAEKIADGAEGNVNSDNEIDDHVDFLAFGHHTECSCGCLQQTVKERYDESISDTLGEFRSETFWDLAPMVFPELGNLKIYTWPCCSELNCKKFVVGKDIFDFKTDIEKIFRNVVTQSESVVNDLSWSEESILFTNHDEIKVVLMLNDCTSCS